MKKKTVITTEKLEVWFIPQPSEIPAGIAKAPENDSWEPGNEPLNPSPEEHPDKKKTPGQIAKGGEVL